MEIAVARPEEVQEWTKWMREFEEKAFSHDLEDPSVVELALVSPTRLGTFLIWKMLTKGTLT